MLAGGPSIHLRKAKEVAMLIPDFTKTVARCVGVNVKYILVTHAFTLCVSHNNE